MRKCAIAAASVACIAGSSFAGVIGPDVIVGSLPNLQRFGNVGQITGYSIATTSCNIGDQILNWNPNTNIHPVISQSISRVGPAGDNGTKIEMLGISWLKHGFCALQGTVCGSCQPAGGGCPPRLGIGCSDPYSSGLNGQQSNLGLPADVNAHTGFYSMPFTGVNQSGNQIFKRIQVDANLLDPGQNPGATYWGAGQYVQSEDSSFGNQDNNASHRQILVSSGSVNSGYNLLFTGSTVREEPVIFAWETVDNSVTIIPVDVPETATAGDNNGRVYFAYDVSQNNDGTWHYEYAMNNVSSDNRIRGFRIPGLDIADMMNIEFTDVDYHSGSPISNTDWNTNASTSDDFEIRGPSFGSNPNANSLWWGRLYRIGFDSPNAPEMVTAQLRTFKSNELLDVSVMAPQSANVCLGDCDGSGTVDFNDLVAMLFEFGSADDGACNADLTGRVDFNDLVAALFLFGPCP
ncbi:unnamed protein product [Symbiodinium necroappetens]|uniref:EF-hand domain-containing protein n=1 Tax=Symbiodinium necroappetens TaxID=1628268 RepID=A0A812U0S2_9DINO|nr:unnamed protein product [Symbiodinium necroappetens]